MNVSGFTAAVRVVAGMVIAAGIFTLGFLVMVFSALVWLFGAAAVRIVSLAYLPPELYALATKSVIRRNHVLMHATLNVLSSEGFGPPEFFQALFGKHVEPTRAVTEDGFRIVAPAWTAEAIRAAVEEATSRLHAGEHRLAVYWGCPQARDTAFLLLAIGALVLLGLLGVLGILLMFPALGASYLLAGPVGTGFQRIAARWAAAPAVGLVDVFEEGIEQGGAPFHGEVFVRLEEVRGGARPSGQGKVVDTTGKVMDG